MSAALFDLLQKEGHALLGGNLAAALAMQDEKAELISRLREEGANDEALLTRILAKAEENERLFEMARNAARRVSKRVSEIRNQQQRVGYDAYGHGLTHTDQAGSRRL